MRPPATPELTKARGAFYTPPAIAEFIAAWGVNSNDDVVLEPSCGDATFLIAAAAEKRKFGRDFRVDDLVGVEVHPASATEARARLKSEGIPARVEAKDFFECVPDSKLELVPVFETDG